jgi:predicted dithiol-disulfide oxidoreductase (DUF899 family)
MELPKVVSAAEWEVARGGLLAKEKEATRARDALAAERRRLPMVKIDKAYALEGPNGYRDGDNVFRTYFTDQRGVEALGSNWTFLDLTPLGRQEDWEDSPARYPQTPRYQWWRLHDEYDEERS